MTDDAEHCKCGAMLQQNFNQLKLLVDQVSQGREPDGLYRLHAFVQLMDLCLYVLNRSLRRLKRFVAISDFVQRAISFPF